MALQRQRLPWWAPPGKPAGVRLPPGQVGLHLPATPSPTSQLRALGSVAAQLTRSAQSLTPLQQGPSLRGGSQERRLVAHSSTACPACHQGCPSPGSKAQLADATGAPELALPKAWWGSNACSKALCRQCWKLPGPAGFMSASSSSGADSKQQTRDQGSGFQGRGFQF